jgi:hypothetical protein
VATTDQLIARAKVILSRTGDTALDAKVITQLAAAQERLEDEAFLPDFLYQKQDITINAEDVDLEVALTRYIRLHDRSGGIWYELANAEDGETHKKLPRVDERNLFVQRYPGSLAVGGVVQAYFMVDRLATFRPKPSALATQNLTIHFYQSESVIPAAGNSTLWTQRAADYLLGEAGLILAQTLRDKDALGLFQALRSAGKARLIKRSQSDEQADQEYMMGDRD